MVRGCWRKTGVLSLHSLVSVKLSKFSQEDTCTGMDAQASKT